MKKYLTEFIGTFFLVLTTVLSASDPNIAPMAPMAIGAIYLAMVYAGIRTSGGHYNPAITLAVLICRKMDRGDALYYIIVQLIASILAAALGVYLHDCSGGLDIATRINEQSLCIVLTELLGTFALVYVMLRVTEQGTVSNNAYAGLALGFTLMALSFGLGSLSGAAFNPAIVLGASIAGMFGWDEFLIYLIGIVVGAAAAATAVQLIDAKEE